MGSMEQLALGWEPQRRTFTVAELNARIRGLLGDEFDDVWVAGEVSGCRTVASGHCYFTLKDKESIETGLVLVTSHTTVTVL